jgi:hypothetical protein
MNRNPWTVVGLRTPYCPSALLVSMLNHIYQPTAVMRCRSCLNGPWCRRVSGPFTAVLVLLVGMVTAAAAEPDLVWTAERGDTPNSYAITETLQESVPANEPASQPPLSPLPPTQPRGPVVLDVPYEESPISADGGAMPGSGFPEGFDDLWAARPWSWQIMPNNLIYTSYLAGPKEPRIGTSVYRDTAKDPLNPSISNGTLWDTTLGGRASILRYGSDPVLHPQGFEVQIEGAAFVRLDPQDDRDLRSGDYRFGVPLVYGIGRWQTKLAYYHNSAHLGDEAMLKYPDFPRINYVRDCIVWGNSYYLFDWLRLYGEVGYSFFNSGGSEPWEFQYGTELIQARPTGIRGAPFFAINGISRQELDWGGNVCVQTGWAWRGRRSEKLFRIGFEYLYGSDPQFEFPFANQNRYGAGMWYDF